jgi:predicted nucleic acid-binding protein
MIVYVETNFIFELAFLREEYESCHSLLGMAKAGEINLVLPAFSLGEPYEAWVRRSKRRTELHDRLNTEIGELSRSKPYEALSRQFQEVTDLLRRSVDDEKQRLDQALSQLLAVAEVIPIGSIIIEAAIDLQANSSLKPQDSIIYASILQHLTGAPAGPKCFITLNRKDFDNPDLVSELSTHNCRLLLRFRDAVGYVRSPR